MFDAGKTIRLFVSPYGENSTLGYAAAELERLIRLGGFSVETEKNPDLKTGIWIGRAFPVDISTVKFDGFVLSVQNDAAGIAAPTEKGVLNGVYELAERLGFRFLTPFPDGELVPGTFAELRSGTEVRNPRFAHRGIFILGEEISSEDRTRFFAKLKYNAVCYHGKTAAPDSLCRMLGLRKEVGGHGFARLLDRNLFDSKPDYFRMFQPDDLGGKRQPDSNLCVTNPEVRKIVVDQFREKLKQQPDLYALHCWADDLPAGGWCWCPSCRSYAPTAQNMLGMKLLCRAADAEHLPHRVPVIAYHDTLFPDAQVPAEKRMFLLWAPRERCYAHAIDDPDCPRNVKHWEALLAWQGKFAGIDDAHTFEYYLDQLLFNGIHPFTPEIIAKDMKAYWKAGIESHMTLQCLPFDIIPDYNQQFFARAHWEPEITEDSFLDWLTDDIAFRDFLRVRGRALRKSLAMCGHDMQIYLDFRYLPESNDAFSRHMADVYRESSEELSACAKRFAASLPAAGPWRRFMEQNLRQTEFEAAELTSMHYQQAAMCKFAEAQMTNSEAAAREGCGFLEKNLASIDLAESRCRAAGYPDDWWHLHQRIAVERREAKSKLEKYSKFVKL